MKRFLIALLFASCVLPYSVTAANEKTEFFSLNSIQDFKSDESIKDKTLIIFSSRDYVSFLITASTAKPSEVYWVVPADDVGEDDLKSLENYLTDSKLRHELKISSEVISGTIEEVTVHLVPKRGIPAIAADASFIFIDVDFFFRTFKNDVKTPKMEEVLKFYKSIDDYDWNPSQIYLIKSLDINLPDWVQEYGYAVKHFFNNWLEKEVPSEYIAIDEIDQLLYYFGENEEAYDLLKQIEKSHEDNPYYYKRLFTAALKTFHDDDVLAAARKAYSLDRGMIALYIEGADFLMEKGEIFPAYVLVKDGLENEPWNKTLTDRLRLIIEAGYNFYTQHSDNKELFEFFAKQKERIIQNKEETLEK